jgi:phosphatidylglycerophosphatase C
MSDSVDPLKPSVALFDLDGTLTWRDTLRPFLGGYLIRHPRRLFSLWRLLPALAGYALHRDRGRLKSQAIRMVMGGAERTSVEAWADTFVGRSQARHLFRPAALAVLAAHRAAGDRLVLMSASPDLYVPRIGTLLGFERTLCTEINWRAQRLDGSLKTPNLRGEEKLRCLIRLRAQYPGLPFVAYGNSASDLAHMKQADRALLVNGNAAARRAAAGVGIPTGEWTIGTARLATTDAP